STSFSPVLAEITLKVLGFILAHNQSSTPTLLSDDRLHDLLRSQEKIAILTNNISLAIESCEHITRLDYLEDQRAKAQTRIGEYLMRTKTISNLEAARVATEKSLAYPEIIDPVRAQALTQLANIH